MDNKALFKLSYGLFVLTAKEGDFDNGCITNTAIQISSGPEKIAFAVNKGNKTHDMIKATGIANVSVLSEKAPFEIYKIFGFQSGRDVDKFSDFDKMERSNNGLYYIKEYANSYFSLKITEEIDAGSHTLFIADITDMVVLNDEKSVTYEYYHANVKPKRKVENKDEKKTVKWVCNVCGYVYEGEELPADFICPWCKHGVEAFEKVID